MGKGKIHKKKSSGSNASSGGADAVAAPPVAPPTKPEDSRILKWLQLVVLILGALSLIAIAFGKLVTDWAGTQRVACLSGWSWFCPDTCTNAQQAIGRGNPCYKLCLRHEGAKDAEAQSLGDKLAKCLDEPLPLVDAAGAGKPRQTGQSGSGGGVGATPAGGPAKPQVTRVATKPKPARRPAAAFTSATSFVAPDCTQHGPLRSGTHKVFQDCPPPDELKTPKWLAKLERDYGGAVAVTVKHTAAAALCEKELEEMIAKSPKALVAGCAYEIRPDELKVIQLPTPTP